MQLFKSDKYEIVGFRDHESNGIPVGWILRQIPPQGRLNFDSNTLIVKELKYVDRGRIYFMKSDGSIWQFKSLIKRPSLTV
jgi:hypothetical protein